MKHLRTLRVRFALWTAGFLLAALLLFGAFVYANMSHSLVTPVDETLRLSAMQLQAEVTVRNDQLLVMENPIEDKEYTQLREQGLSMRIFDRNGQTVSEYGPYGDLPPLLLPAGVMPNQPGQFATMTHPSSKDLVRIFAIPIIDDDRVAGTLQIAHSLANVRDTLSLLLGTLLIAGPLIILLAAAGGYYLALRALAPVDNITRTARQISASDLSTRLALPQTEDEVGRLATTFDTMLARLDTAFQRERRFVADASHELRTPLSAMHLIVSSTLARKRSPQDYQEALRDVQCEVEQMRTMVDGLLQLARSDAAGHQTKLEYVDLAALLKDVADSLRPLAEDKRLEILDRVPDHNLYVVGDSDGLIRLFSNLLHNAVKYTQQGFISVAAKAQGGDMVEVTISDTGAGIPPQHLPQIFDRFYRVDASRSTEGIGLGLAIALDIAHAHGGNIHVASESDRGTTFTVTLPLR
jgi:heavy metal sensor kinase